ncbi:hypothetical protein A1O3_10309 [Capronia epimyces CBS 606.96]|uniref:Uncharacterized protein n=1 Tax=Capronia epimyces CBS 606.96 TaxID=1182542 RepID=W9XJJ5_9EURO|nr:uncharacterized protein A1O3_10309 [Capronia epimyces CBS 606.96]EXJ77151.1 hypothetical protein A1O3_10309 [Capronia epimyces CBS 606.96]
MGIPDAAIGIICPCASLIAIIGLFGLRDYIKKSRSRRRRRRQQIRAEAGLAEHLGVGVTELEALSSTSSSPIDEPAPALLQPPRAAEELERSVSRPGVTFASSRRRTTVYNRWDVATVSSISDSLTTVSTAPPPYSRMDEHGLPAYESNLDQAGDLPSGSVSSSSRHQEAPAPPASALPPPRPFPPPHPEIAMPRPTRARTAAQHRALRRESALEERYRVILNSFPQDWARL